MTAFRRSKWTLTAPTLADLIDLCAAMRADELEQWGALVDPEPFDLQTAAARMFLQPGVKFSLYAGPRLLVSGGYFDVGNGVMRSWMIGTPDAWRDHWRSITEGTKFVMDCLLDDGFRRLETYALASRELTGHWYVRGLGMQRDGILPGYGFNGEDVAVYSRVRSRVAPADFSDWKEREAARG